MIKTLLIILFFTLPLVHGGILATLWMDFKLIVSGNFEFTKSIFFNILSSLILISFLIDSFFEKKLSPLKKKEYWVILLISIILISSTIFSISPFTSMIWDDNKGHTSLLFFNLLWIFFVLRNLDLHFLNKLILTSLLSWICVSLIAMKELYSPSFNYGHLADRALGSFGHPNYFAGYLLLLLPFTQIIKSSFSKVFLLLIFWIWILLSKSIVAIVLAFWYILFLLFTNPPIFLRKIVPLTKGDRNSVWKWGIFWIILLCISILLTFITLFLPEKLHSFLSRFYLWETTLAIILSDWKILLFGWGLETLSYVFESFKSPEVYIYENFGFTADRPHNFLLNIFYHFWVLWVLLFVYLVYNFMRKFSSIKYPSWIAITLFLLFWIIHFFSIASYLILILCIAYNAQVGLTYEEEETLKKEKALLLSIPILITLISIIWTYYSLQFYSAERLYAQKDYTKAQSIFSHPKYMIALQRFDEAQEKEWILSTQNIKSQISVASEKIDLCKKLTLKFSSPENYFYCGEIFEKLWEAELSREYYKRWLSLLPDLWNEDSPYWNNYFIKSTITGNRFFSEKFWDIRAVLEKVEK